MHNIIKSWIVSYSLVMTKNGFTLAEVLITLGIIGVVASLTLPSVINNSRNKQFEAGLKKAYSVVSQAFNMYQADMGDRPDASTFLGKRLKDNIMPYFKVVQDCGAGQFYQNNVCISSGSDPYRRYDGRDGWGIYAYYAEEGSFILADGSFVRIFHQPWGYTRCVIAVDTNGFGKKPNRAGFDLFTFELTTDGKVLPAGSPGTSFYYGSNLPDSHVNNLCSRKYNNNGSNGVACAYKALTDKNYFKNLPK